MIRILTNVWEFIKAFFVNLYLIFDLPAYFRILGNYTDGFTVLDWMFAISAIMAILIAVALLIYIIVLGIYRAIKARRMNLEKEELVEQIDDLNQRVIKLISEKDKILALQVSKLGLKPEETGEAAAAEGEKKPDAQTVSRFVKLIEVDRTYRESPWVLTDKQAFTLPELCENFINFSAKELRLFYNVRIARLFFAGMATSKLIIVEGISGTGKTSLPYAMGKYLRNPSALIPVQPSWRDKSELLGYLNEFTKRFNETDFLQAMYNAANRNDVGFIVLDEMNLARIEYYFAEILSVLEMPNSDEWKIDVVPDTWPTDPVLLSKGKLKFPTNLWFVGTANNDDSTFTITDKVYDRAVAIPLNEKGKPFEGKPTKSQEIDKNYLMGLFAQAKAKYPWSQESKDKFAELDDFVAKNFRLTFGNRILKQIGDFIPVYVGCGGTELDGLDFMLCYKILRKFEGLNIAYEQENLKKLILLLERLYGKTAMEESKSYIRRLLRVR